MADLRSAVGTIRACRRGCFTHQLWQARSLTAPASTYMFHLLSSFNLPSGTSEAAFRRRLLAFHELLLARDLIVHTGALCQRVHHPIMDTDEEHGQQYSFLMDFRDRSQCDAAVTALYTDGAELADCHQRLWEQVEDAVFSCWETL